MRLCVALYCKGTRHVKEGACVYFSLSQAPAIIGGFGQLFRRRTSQVSGALVESGFVLCAFKGVEWTSEVLLCCRDVIRDHPRRCQHSFLLKCGCRSFPSCSLQYGEHQGNTSEHRRICCSCGWSARRSTIHSTLVLHCQPSYICPLPSQATPYQAC